MDNNPLHNYPLIAACSGWLLAQVIKFILNAILNHELQPERLWGNGGMPSSHSATVCALTVAAAVQYGLASFSFAISLVLAAVVMTDAAGVRLETGKQAKLLNMLTESLLRKHEPGETNPLPLKELIGHTPLQVLVGALLGAGIGLGLGAIYSLL